MLEVRRYWGSNQPQVEVYHLNVEEKGLQDENMYIKFSTQLTTHNLIHISE